MSTTEIRPAIDYHDFNARGRRIYEERVKARTEAEELGIEEAEADFEYRKRKSIRLAHYRNQGQGVTEAEIHAEGDVAEWRMKRELAHNLRRSCEHRIAELEGNRAMLRQAASMSEGL